MKRAFWLSNKFFNYQLLIICIVSLSLAISKVALAKFQPPTDASSPTDNNTGSSGHRTGSCDANSETELTLLSPIDPIRYVEQVNSNEITFAWFVPSLTSSLTSDKTPTMEFNLYLISDGKNYLIPLKTNLQFSPGIMTVSIPKEQLLVGKRYRVQVAIHCNPAIESEYLQVTAQLDVKPVQPDLISKIAQTTDSLQRADIFAKAGLWNNAVTEALTAKDQEESKVKQYLVTLLKDLKGIEEEKLKEKFPNIEKENLETFCDAIADDQTSLKDICYQVKALNKIIQTQALLSAAIVRSSAHQ